MRMRSLFQLLLLAVMIIAPGCQEVEEPLPGGPKPLPPEVFKPTTNVDKVVLQGEIAASDSDHDGVPDVVNVFCFLFPPPSSGAIAVVGKGAFRFEVYDPRDPAPGRMPLAQINYNYEQSLRHGTNRYGMPAYQFPIRLRSVPSGVTEVFIRGRFFPEGMDPGDPDIEPTAGGISVLMSTSTPTVRPAPAQPASAPDTGPKTFRIELRPPEKKQ